MKYNIKFCKGIEKVVSDEDEDYGRNKMRKSMKFI